MIVNHTRVSQVDLLLPPKRAVKKLKSDLSRWINFEELNGGKVPLAEKQPRAQPDDDGENLLGSEVEETLPKGTVQPVPRRQSVYEKVCTGVNPRFS